MGVATMFAQKDILPTDATFSSDKGDVVKDSFGVSHLELSTRDAIVKVEFDKPLPPAKEATLTLFISPGAADFTADMIQIENPAVQDGILSVDLTSELWGNPYVGEYHTTIMVTWLKPDGDFFYDDDEEPIFFQMPCVTPNTVPAKFLYAYPSGEWEEGDDFTTAYNRGNCQFNFNNIVEFASSETSDAIGEIVFKTTNSNKYVDITLLKDGDIPEGGTVPVGKASIGWNPIDGNFVVQVQYKDPSLPVESISSIEITLWDMTSLGKDISEETVIISNSNAKKIAKFGNGNNTAGMNLIQDNEVVTVYNIQGVVVRENIAFNNVKDLPKGLYIVNGKKLIVR